MNNANKINQEQMTETYLVDCEVKVDGELTQMAAAFLEQELMDEQTKKLVHMGMADLAERI